MTDFKGAIQAAFGVLSTLSGSFHWSWALTALMSSPARSVSWRMRALVIPYVALANNETSSRYHEVDVNSWS
jgi:hypothetical protein